MTESSSFNGKDLSKLECRAQLKFSVVNLQLLGDSKKVYCWDWDIWWRMWRFRGKNAERCYNETSSLGEFEFCYENDHVHSKGSECYVENAGANATNRIANSVYRSVRRRT